MTQDGKLADQLRAVRKHGSYKKYVHEVIGGNFRLDALQAALLRVKLPHLSQFNMRRNAIAQRYREALEPLRKLGKLRFQQPHARHVHHQFVIRTEQRDRVRDALADQGIGSEVYYPVALNRQPIIQTQLDEIASCPEAEAASRDSLALPCFPELSEEEQRAVVDALHAAYR